MASPTGLKAAGEVPAAPSTPAERLALWCDRLPSPAPEMLRTLAAEGERYMEADELAVALGKKPTGGHWNSGIAVLRNNGLIETDRVRAGGRAPLWRGEHFYVSDETWLRTEPARASTAGSSSARSNGISAAKAYGLYKSRHPSIDAAESYACARRRNRSGRGTRLGSSGSAGPASIACSAKHRSRGNWGWRCRI